MQVFVRHSSAPRMLKSVRHGEIVNAARRAASRAAGSETSVIQCTWLNSILSLRSAPHQDENDCWSYEGGLRYSFCSSPEAERRVERETGPLIVFRQQKSSEGRSYELRISSPSVRLANVSARVARWRSSVAQEQ